MSRETEDVGFYRDVWTKLAGDEFTDKRLADRVRRDGGYDMENLGESDVLALIHGQYLGDWKEVAFSFSELLAYYSVAGAIVSPDQVVGWVFCSFVIAEAIRRDVTDWELQFDKFINGFSIVRDKLKIEDAVQVFERVFGAN